MDCSNLSKINDQFNFKNTLVISQFAFNMMDPVRNKLISETDWTQLKDVNLDIIRERDWKNYRQALRDLPANSNPKLTEFGTLDMSSVNWPDKPSS